MAESCAYHPEAPACAVCGACGRDICAGCRTPTPGGLFCGACAPMAASTACFLCAAPESRVLHFRRVASLLVTSNREYALRVCRTCATRTGLGDLVVTAFLGWWGIPGLFLTPAAIAANLKTLDRYSALPRPFVFALAAGPLILLALFVGWWIRDLGHIELPEPPPDHQGPPGTPDRDLSRAASEGLHLMDTGKYEEALPFLAKVAASQPANSLAAYHHACALQALRRHPEAIVEFQRAVEHDPMQVDYRLGYASSAIAVERFSEAIAALDEILARLPHQESALFLRALVDYRDGRPAEAVARLQSVRVGGTAGASISFLLGVAASDLARYDVAIPAFEDSIAIDPKNAEAHHALQQAMCDAGRLAEARRRYQQWSDASPDSALLAACLGRLFTDGVRDRAAYERATTLGGRCYWGWYGLAWTRLAHGDPAGGIEAARQARSVIEDSPEALHLEVTALLALGRVEEARTLAETNALSRLDDPFSGRLRIEVHMKAGEWERAVAVLGELKTRLAARPASLRRLRSTEAEVALGAGKPAEAEAAWAAIADDPSSGPSMRGDAEFQRAALAWLAGDASAAAARWGMLADAPTTPPELKARAALWAGLALAGSGRDSFAQEAAGRRWAQAALDEDLPDVGNSVALPAKFLLSELTSEALDSAFAGRRAVVRNDIAFIRGWAAERIDDLPAAIAAYTQAAGEHNDPDFPAPLARAALKRLGVPSPIVPNPPTGEH